MNLNVSRGVELLGKLEQTTTDFARREEALNRDIRSRRYTTERKYHDTIAGLEEKIAAQLAEVDTTRSDAEARVRAVHSRRAAEIDRTYATGIRLLPKHSADAKSGFLGNLQMRRYRLERKVTADIKHLETHHESNIAKLTELSARIAKTDRRAKNCMSGYPSFVKKLRPRKTEIEPATDAPEVIAAMEASLDHADEQIKAFRVFGLPRIFSVMPLAGFIGLFLILGACVAFAMGASSTGFAVGGGLALVLTIVFAILHAKGAGQSAETAAELAASVVEAKRLQASTRAMATIDVPAETARLNAEFERAAAEIQVEAAKADAVEADFRQRTLHKLETHAPRARAKNDALLEAKLGRIEAQKARQVQSIESELGTRKDKLVSALTGETSAIDQEGVSRWAELEADWKASIVPLYQSVGVLNDALLPRFPEWSERFVEGWEAPTHFEAATKFAHIDLDLARKPDGLPKDPRLALPGPAALSIPMALTFPDHGSLLFETDESGGATEIGTLNNIILRLLSTTPPGKIAFTIIDPVGLGQNFAGLMHIADYEESLINRRIWTQRDQIEERLAEMNEHIEKVIQMYLRNEYATITEYNEKAGSVAEKYHFLVVADFPSGFSETAAARLQSIAISGPRCGIFTLIHWDQRQSPPDGFVPDELRKNSVCIRQTRDGFVVDPVQVKAGAKLVFDAPPQPDVAVNLVHKIGKASIDSNRVEVPFEQIAPRSEEYWTNETTTELKIAIGRTGATKLQYLAIGKGTRQHALFAGKTGSGKSTLFHVIITNLALACSPEQVEFYLIDFKKGVEFKCYATHRLPHARVVAIESDREFALSVLQRVDEELKRRGDMFRKLGVQDVAGYKRVGGTEPMPRTLLLIDEFQEFFVDDDTIAQTASLLFDRIVRQGRAFGIHVLLGSQTLGGAYTLARATLGQMVIRVALQCNEADAYLIMDENNAAPRLLTRPGEGIYNDAAGAMEGNSPFQVVWLPDEERDEWLEKVRGLAIQHGDKHPGPIVFEGNAPAAIDENYLLADVLKKTPTTAPVSAKIWLGAPNSIKGPTQVTFHRQSGNHLLIVGQRDEAALSILGLGMIALAAQHPVGAAKFYLFHQATPETPDAAFIDRVIAAIPHGVTVARGQEVGEAMNEIATEMKERTADSDLASKAAPIFVFIHGQHKFKKLRNEDEFDFSMGDSDSGGNPGKQLADVITEGSSLGIHLITTLDTFNNVNRCMSRKALTEFEMRVVFQMSANDSASLIDSPKASNLGLHRALLHNEHEGSLETFRPYALPEASWIAEVAAKLAARK